MVLQSLTDALNSTDPHKLYRALHACSTEALREVSLGCERGAYLGAMCSAHYANRFLTILEALTPMASFRRSDMTVACVILHQLGGQRFVAMTGAKFLLAHESALSFHLPSNFAKNGINRVRIDLAPTDLYDVTFQRARGLKIFYEVRSRDCTPISCMLRSLRPLASKSLSVPRERTPLSPACDSPLSILQMRSLHDSLQEIRSERSYVPSYPVPSNDGYSVIPLGDAEGKPVKSIHIYQDDEALNVDLEFEDKSMLEMIFRVGFRSTINLLENHDGDYHIRKRIKPKRSAE
jgi:hypothetical protein